MNKENKLLTVYKNKEFELPKSTNNKKVLGLIDITTFKEKEKDFH